MVDIVSKEKRSEMMAGIRGKDTTPEIILRKFLHKNGYRFRLHGKKLHGRPDLVLPKWKTVIFVHGCYWHGHVNCELFRLPKTRTEFWKNKIEGNRERDARKAAALVEAGWKVVCVWECAITKKRRLSEELLLEFIEKAMLSRDSLHDIRSHFE